MADQPVLPGFPAPEPPPEPAIDYDDDGALLIHTFEGTLRADWGDWIIRGVKGEIYPCRPDIFEATYELVEDEGGRLDGEALPRPCGHTKDIQCDMMGCFGDD
ncbi:MAG: hypothetical protein ACOC9T_00210 [Myxococcota bacterium]